MTTHMYQPKNLLRFLSKGIMDHSIGKNEKVITMLNSLIDDRKDRKIPF